MKRRTLLAGSVIAMGATEGASGAGSGDTDTTPTSGPDRAAAEAGIREGINNLRYSKSVAALGGDDILREVARDHSTDMAARDFFAHRNPDGEGPTDRAGCPAGETIYRADVGRVESAETGDTYDTSTADGLAALVAESWGVSRDHYPILIDSAYQNVGVGVHIADGVVFATAVFC